jgi:hypothetical protein
MKANAVLAGTLRAYANTPPHSTQSTKGRELHNRCERLVEVFPRSLAEPLRILPRLVIEREERVRDTQPTRSGLRSIAGEREEGRFYRGKGKRNADA